MKNKYNLLILPFAFMLNIKHGITQNIINNASFEINDPNETTAPDAEAQADKMTEWETDQKDCNINNEPAHLHSPDWYKNGSGFIQLKEIIPPSSSLTIVPAKEGNAFVCIGAGELIEQEFHPSAPIIGGQKYTMSFFIRNFQGAITTTALSYGRTWTSSSEVHLKVFLATQKIKYKDIIDCDNVKFCFDGEDTYDDKKDLTINNVSEVQDITVKIADFPLGDWHKVIFEFTAPSDHTYDWIAIEQVSSSNCDNENYIGIDDFSLIESCELGCYATSGIPNAGIGTDLADGAFAVVSGLTNVETATVYIFPVGGQYPIWELTKHNSNGLATPMYWFGYQWAYDNDGNIIGVTDAADATYVCTVVMTNDCGTFQESENIVKPFNHSGTFLSQPAEYSGPKIPNPCCVYDLYLNNATFTGSDTYSAGHNVIAGPALTLALGSNTVFNASHEIQLNDGFSVIPGALFSAFIVDCPNFRISDQNTNNPSNIQLWEVENLVEATGAKTNLFTIAPNPNQGIFTVFGNDIIKDVLILDVAGKIKYKKNNINNQNINLDVSGLERGTYLVHVSYVNETSASVGKIVIH